MYSHWGGKNEGSNEIRKELFEENPESAGSDAVRSFDELALSQRKDLTTNHPRKQRPRREADHGDDENSPGTDRPRDASASDGASRGDPEGQQKRRECQKEIDDSR